MRHVLQLLPPISFFLLKGFVEETVLFKYFTYLAYAGIFLTIFPNTLLVVDRKVDFDDFLFGILELFALLILVVIAVTSPLCALAMLYLFDFSRISIYLNRANFTAGIYTNIFVRVVVNICLILYSGKVLSSLLVSIVIIVLIGVPIFLVGHCVLHARKSLSIDVALGLFREQSVYYGDLLLNGVDKLVLAGAVNSVLIEYTYIRRVFQIINSIYLNFIRDYKVRFGRVYEFGSPLICLALGAVFFVLSISIGLNGNIHALFTYGLSLACLYVMATPLHFKFVYHIAPSIILGFNVFVGLLFNILLFLGINVFFLFYFFILLNIILKYWYVDFSKTS